MATPIPTKQEFHSAAKTGNVVALSVTLNFDQETAIALADRFASEKDFFLLESATAGPGGIARYSFLGFDALCSFEANGDSASFEFLGKKDVFEITPTFNPMKALERCLSRFKMSVAGAKRELIDGVDLCSMGGAAGFFGYEVAYCLEPKIGKAPPKDVHVPDAYFFVPKNFLVLDQLSRKLTIIRYAFTESPDEVHQSRVYQANAEALQSVIEKVTKMHRLDELKTLKDQPIVHEHFEQTVTQDEFFKKVELCLEQIRSGEVYQIQIGNRLRTKVQARPFDIFRHLRILNPSPYMAFYRFGEHNIICASPEMMVNVSKDHITHRPIAGTRKRTWDPVEDQKMREELAGDEKERAEHIMLVDLSRNDIGRIAKPGKVTVDELMIVEEYSHVFHLVSQVSGQLLDGLNGYDAMVASFPNGTVSGAPKVRAMELIAELEPCAREFYAGSLGVFDWYGNLKSTLLIRTIHVANGLASTQASAGIVYDSIPKNEWLETRNKMAACLFAMQNTL